MIGVTVRSAFVLLLCLAATPAIPAEEGSVIGVIGTIRGLSRDYELHRGDEILPLRIFGQVMAGDRVVIRNEDGLVRIHLTTGEVRTLERHNSNKALEISGAPATVLSNLIAGVAGLLTPWHDFVELNLSVRTSAPAPTDDPLDLPLLRSEGSTLAAGRRAFTLVWFGGTPPFEVELLQSGDGRKILQAGDLMARELPTRELELLPGSYWLRLWDRAGHLVERTVEAVPAEDVPRAPAELGLAGLPASWRATAHAGWLAQQDGGRWLLEALLEAAPAAAVFGPARELAEFLSVGGVGML